MYRIKVFHDEEQDSLEQAFENWVEQMKEDGLTPIVQQINQNVQNYQMTLTVLYQVQKTNIQVEAEETVPDTLNDFKITEFKKGMTLNFKLFLEEEELDFLANEAEPLIFDGVLQGEFEDDPKNLIMLKTLRKKGILQNFNDAEGNDVFMGTELAQYLWKSFLELVKSKQES